MVVGFAALDAASVGSAGEAVVGAAGADRDISVAEVAIGAGDKTSALMVIVAGKARAALGT